MKDTWPEITVIERSLVVSLALLGAFFGSLLAGPLSDGFGRKIIIIFSDLLFVAGSIIMLMVGRFVVGLGVGIASMIVPVYLSEVSPISTRGAVVACFIVAVTIG